MTTVQERLTSPFFYRVIDSILAQKTSCEFKIILFVPHHSLRTGEPYPDPTFLTDRYDKEKFVIHRCDDMGPATKFTGLLSYLPLVNSNATHIYIADDDIILRDHAFQRMLEVLQTRSRVHDYRRLVLANDAKLLAGMTAVAGYAGILVPKDFFGSLAADSKLAPLWASLTKNQHPCFNVDDMLLSKLFQRFKYHVEGTGQNPFVDIMDRALTDQHPNWIELCKHTSRELDNMKCLNKVLP